ncbi:methyltransferase [Actinosynnema sp. NPDC020468]|uniref:methyltransferase n=1 Tax=Actinosynnema sp. NPDC020468 TaxID=3154488 RepID=UPI0033E07F74
MSEAFEARRSAALVVDQALGYLYPAALRAAAAVGVADHLDRPRTAAELAERTGTAEDGLYRVLRLLATKGLFAQDSQGRFRLTPAGDVLRTDAPISVRSAVLMLTDETMWRPAGELADCLRNDPVFDRIFGVPFFEHFARNPDTAAVFHDGMAAFSDIENDPIAACCDFPTDATVVDVGGGHGGFLLAALTARPDLRGVLHDQAHVLAGHRLGGLPADRWSTSEGDFFTEVPPGDVHVLKRILHDWPDDRCATVLSHCRRALNPGGRVLVVDAVLPPGDEPHQGKALDLMMMASLSGKERTEDDFRALFAAAGLELTRVIPTPTVLSVVEAR